MDGGSPFDGAQYPPVTVGEQLGNPIGFQNEVTAPKVAFKNIKSGLQ